MRRASFFFLSQVNDAFKTRINWIRWNNLCIPLRNSNERNKRNFCKIFVFVYWNGFDAKDGASVDWERSGRFSGDTTAVVTATRRMLLAVTQRSTSATCSFIGKHFAISLEKNKQDFAFLLYVLKKTFGVSTFPSRRKWRNKQFEIFLFTTCATAMQMTTL